MSRKQGAVSSKKPHRNLTAWQKTMDLVVAIYHTTRNFPKEEMYGLTSQLRRTAVSVPSNIAEGAADRTEQQFFNFLSNAIGSLNEIETQLDLALRLGYLLKRMVIIVFMKCWTNVLLLHMDYENHSEVKRVSSKQWAGSRRKERIHCLQLTVHS